MDRVGSGLDTSEENVHTVPHLRTTDPTETLIAVLCAYVCINKQFW